MNNCWNKIIYKLWAPFYDTFFNSGAFLEARKKVFEEIEFNTGEKVLFVGVGTGADLALTEHKNIDITGIDISGDMLQKAKHHPCKFVVTYLRTVIKTKVISQAFG